MNNNIRDKARTWLSKSFDKETRSKVKYMLDNDEAELIESFYKNLEFGTGGMRGIMGPGTNRVNIYTIGMATQGLCNYLNKQFKNKKQISIAIAYDCRNNSKKFGETTANICSANGIKAYLFESLRPTPELSFAVRYFGCQSGVVITASHNPKEYNGYKVYWDDGGQIISPHDKNIISEVQKIKDVSEVKFEDDQRNIEIIGEKIDKEYLKKLHSLSLSPEIIKKNKDLKIVYTPIHGTGVKLVPEILKLFGFNKVYNVPEQDNTDGNFPTVESPNPEEQAALNMAINKAEKVDAELVLATDPDADRVGIAVRNTKGKLCLLNGNQTAALLIYYLITQWNKAGKLKGKEYIVKTIVTTELLVKIAEKYSVEHYDVLTGFKYIADIIKQNEGKKVFICGGEESYGYLAGEFVRDKDAIISCALIAEAAAWAKENGKSLFELLLDIYIEFGFYKESLVSVVKKGKSGASEIGEMMENFRNTPPKIINGSELCLIKDYQKQISYDIINNQENKIDLPVSNVLQFFTLDGSKVSIRPSGTEPKIKFYFGVYSRLENKSDFDKVDKILNEKIERIKSELI
ncbi:phospho-sugar mutase [Bacteroidota bacterium]